MKPSAEALDQASRRVKVLVDYTRDVDDTILSKESKDDLVGWIEFIGAAADSTILMQYFGVFHAVLGFYVAKIQERVDLANHAREKLLAKARKRLQSQTAGGKPTEAATKMEAFLDPAYDAQVEECARLDRLLGFLGSVSRGYDSEIIQNFGHNQRAEMNSDRDSSRR